MECKVIKKIDELIRNYVYSLTYKLYAIIYLIVRSLVVQHIYLNKSMSFHKNINILKLDIIY